MTPKQKIIALYGGAFDPPHLGHASVIQAILDDLVCNEIWLLPSPARHKKIPLASGQNRLQMTKLLVKDLFTQAPLPVKILPYDLEWGKKCTFETMRELEKRFPGYSFRFVFAEKTFEQIKDWISGENFLKEARFLVAGSETKQKYPENVSLLKLKKPLELSSSQIRELFKKQTLPKNSLSPGVLKYIQKNKLYA